MRVSQVEVRVRQPRRTWQTLFPNSSSAQSKTQDYFTFLETLPLTRQYSNGTVLREVCYFPTRSTLRAGKLVNNPKLKWQKAQANKTKKKESKPNQFSSAKRNQTRALGINMISVGFIVANVTIVGVGEI